MEMKYHHNLKNFLECPLWYFKEVHLYSFKFQHKIQKEFIHLA